MMRRNAVRQDAPTALDGLVIVGVVMLGLTMMAWGAVSMAFTLIRWVARW